jgi:hypothetical protein
VVLLDFHFHSTCHPSRPWIILCRLRQVRRVYQAIFMAGPTLIKMLGVVAAYVAFFAAIGVHSFHNYFNKSDTYVDKRDNLDYTGKFNNIVRIYWCQHRRHAQFFSLNTKHRVSP